MHAHWQNLTRSDGRGAFPRNGRAWCHLQGHTLRIEWFFFSNRWALGLELDPDENELTVSFCVGLFSLYFGMSGLTYLLKKLLPQRESSYTPGLFFLQGREISLRIFDGGPWWVIWMDPDEWRSTDPWWRRGHIDLRDVILGKSKHSSQVLRDAVPVQIWMPEGVYQGKAKVERHRWKRPRWFPKIRVDTWIEVENGIPFSGKGENSWDCGDDGLYGAGHEGDDIEAAARAFGAKVIANRKKYGRPSTQAIKEALGL